MRFIVVSDGQDSAEADTFSSVDEVTSHLVEVAADDYATAVALWLRGASMGDSFSLSNSLKRPTRDHWFCMG